MDIETRLEELAQAHAAGRLDEVELARRREELLREATIAGSPVAFTGHPAVGDEEQAGLKSDGLIEGAGLEVLESGMVIGPSEHRVRLLHDLGGKGRVWMVLAVAPDTERGRGIADEFRAVKIFPQPNQMHGLREAGRDERFQRADLIGSRAYLTKVRTLSLIHI